MTTRFRRVLHFFCGGAGTIFSTLLGWDFISKRLARVCSSSLLLDKDSHCGSEVSDGVIVTRVRGVRVSTRTLSDPGGGGLEKYKITSSCKRKLNISTRRSCMSAEQEVPSTHRLGRAFSTKLQNLLRHNFVHLLKDLDEPQHYLIIADFVLRHS